MWEQAKGRWVTTDLKLQPLPYEVIVCEVASLGDVNQDAEFFFLGRTDEEVSLVCRTQDVPAATLAREDGWRAFRIQGVLDFSLVGVLSRISTLLADAGIGIFAVSTYNTDYILVKAEDFEHALGVLECAGYVVGDGQS